MLFVKGQNHTLIQSWIISVVGAGIGVKLLGRVDTVDRRLLSM
jgi:hypothetical protein